MSRKPLTEDQKQAARARATAWRLANLERLRSPENRAKRCAQAKAYAERNAAALVEKRRQQYHEDIEKSREKARTAAAKCRLKNPEAIRQRKREAYARDMANPEKRAKLAEASKARYARNADKLRQRYAERVESGTQWTEAQLRLRAEIAKKWQIENRERVVAKCAERSAAKSRAMPKWVDRAKLLEVYRAREAITRETGIEHHVDHVVPLRGRFVSGLHVPWNLRVIPAAENRRKSNKLIREN